MFGEEECGADGAGGFEGFGGEVNGRFSEGVGAGCHEAEIDTVSDGCSQEVVGGGVGIGGECFLEEVVIGRIDGVAKAIIAV